MNEDGTIDYSNHSAEDLQEACFHIDRTRYPLNLRNLLGELKARGLKDPTTEPKPPAGRKTSTVDSFKALYSMARAAYLTTFTGCALIALFVLEHLGTGDPVAQAIDTAGLVKPLARDGEWWRLLTGPLLHANIKHLYYNFITLFLFGGMVEMLVSREVIPLLILLSALGGSLASLLFLPDTTTVGISGACMGIMGFFLAWQLTRQPRLPAAAFSWVCANIALTLVIGAVSYKTIDNAAHLGGLFVGLGLGLLLTDGRHGEPPLEMPSLVRWLGRLSAMVLLAGFAGAAVLLARTP